MPPPQALIVTRDTAFASHVTRALAALGLTWSHVRDGAGARRCLALERPRLIVVQLSARGRGHSWLQDLLVQPNRPGVLAVADRGDLDLLIDVLRSGADDYVALPGAAADWIERATPLVGRDRPLAPCDELPATAAPLRHSAEPFRSPSVSLAPVP